MRDATEAEVQATLVDAARQFGWRFAHFRPARTAHGWRTAMTGDVGFPDLTLARGSRLVFIEVKGEKGRLSPEQKAWRDALLAVPGVEWWLVRPSSLDDALRLLATDPRTA